MKVVMHVAASERRPVTSHRTGEEDVRCHLVEATPRGGGDDVADSINVAYFYCQDTYKPPPPPPFTPSPTGWKG